MPKPRPAPAKKASDAMILINLTAGKWVSQAIAVAAELGIVDLLKDGPKAAADIARAANASEDGVYRLLRALGSVGLFAETGERRFRLTPLGKRLRTDSPEAIGGYARFIGHESTWRPWGELRHSVHTGEPAFDQVFGMPIFEYYARMPEAAAVFDAAMTSISTFESQAVVAAYDFSGVGTLVDVAGGHGLLITAILKTNRRMGGILFDLPHVTAGAPALLQSRGLADRCQIVSGDFFEFVPEGGDAYIMKHIIHDWDEERATQILRNCHRAMRPGGKVLIVDAVIPAGNAAHFGKLLDLEMLVLTPRGRERTKVEFQNLLQRSGFRLRRVVSTESHLSVVEGERT
ncbi:MAG TPA: methyltransferase [Gemmatimonadales bacterium]|nr:methyltransferase [Gemmatimonadales bacterium]